MDDDNYDDNDDDDDDDDEDDIIPPMIDFDYFPSLVISPIEQNASPPPPSPSPSPPLHHALSSTVIFVTK
ncbi:hypothetical protein M0804_012057 [Polistes exclamans]|nr:hypothetical protein M0804_012057 [Polistes exclamans]